MQINTNFIPFMPASPDIYVVGGTVRDILLNMLPQDYDIVTLGDPIHLAGQIAEKSKGRVIELGKPGMTIYRVTAGRQTFDIAPARGGGIESDLKKRDFTINALAASVSTGRVIDLQSGVKDIRDKKIRMVSKNNLVKDPIRLLRAYRMGACLNFSIEPKTRAAISQTAFQIYGSAGERIQDELMKLFCAPGSTPYLVEMDETGLLSEIFPEIRPLKHCAQNRFHDVDVFAHTISAYAFLEKIIQSPGALFSENKEILRFLEKTPRMALLKYALLLHDIGKPRAKTVDSRGDVHFYTHGAIGAGIASEINHRLRFSNKEKQYVNFIIKNHLRPLFLFLADQKNRLSPKAVSRFFMKSGEFAQDLLVHAVADTRAKGNKKKEELFSIFVNNMLEFYFNKFLPVSAGLPLISGHDLINEFRLTPSPFFARVLEHVNTECAAKNINNREDALNIARNFLNLHRPLDKGASF